jgi:hypothetical protein
VFSKNHCALAKGQAFAGVLPNRCIASRSRDLYARGRSNHRSQMILSVPIPQFDLERGGQGDFVQVRVG